MRQNWQSKYKCWKKSCKESSDNWQTSKKSYRLLTPNNALFVPQCIFNAFPQNDSHILHRVVGVYFQVSAGLKGQVNQGMAGQSIQHMVKKRMPRCDGGASRAVQVQFHADVRFTRDPFARSVTHATLLYLSLIHI